MMKYIYLFIGTFAIFMAIDLLWIGVLMKDFYRDRIGFLMAKDVRWGAAMVFYVLYIAGILYFVVLPVLESRGGIEVVLLKGALLGLLCYATYDLTNMATLEGWPLSMVVVDMIWGTILTALVSGGSFLLASKWIFSNP
ncbi:MAG TPA: DUF2177 family protein [Rhodothermales bacterium]|nr:DUF2177 family protein [Rhodothermales bacterium]